MASTPDVDAAIGTMKLDNAVIVVVGDLTTIQADVEAKVPADWRVVERP